MGEFLLTNRKIADNYKNYKFWIMPSEFIGAFAYWVYYQGKGMEMSFEASILAFKDHIYSAFENPNLPQEFSVPDIETLVSEQTLKGIPSVLLLNINEDNDFIDLGALERNVKFMILRNQITQP